MSHLKSRTEHPPHSFQFLQPETGQTAPFVGSFNFVVEQTIRLRQANPFLCERHGWSLNIKDVENEVDAYNTARCIAGGWLTFVVMDDAPMSAYTAPVQKKTTGLFQSAVDKGKRITAGVAVLVDWLGSGAKPVDHVLADKRASVCATCPKNDGGDFTKYFTQPIADKIRTQMEIRGDLQLRTPHDEKLTVCSACDCPLKLKVWVPLDHILAYTSEETKTRLDPRCWILKGT
jgi:hypothetical protein